MRPIRLELEGFTAFREKTVVDFAGADLFVLCGPTGSGKSSLIDAMTFALYGSVARYGDPKLVHPVISQGRQEARVRFGFSVDGAPYTAVRVVRRVKRRDGQGAVTKEARLESGDRVLAGTAGELDEAIARLIGLSFDQFCTCVVLPQGEFARFLHATPAIRQDLLKELLRIRIYDRMARLAKDRETQAKARVAGLDLQLAELSSATPEAKRDAEHRAAQLGKLRKTADGEQREIERLERERSEKQDGAGEAEKVAKLLAGVKVPSGVGSVAADAARAAGELAAKEKERESAEAALASAEAERAKLPDPDPLRQLVKDHADRDARRAELDAARKVAARSAQAAMAASDALESAAREVEAAQGRLDAIRRAHAASHLAEGLSPGDPCPVCFRTLDEAPVHPVPADVAQAQARVDAAKQAHGAKARAHLEAAKGASGDAGKVDHLASDVATLDARLAGAAPLADVQGSLTAIEAAAARVEVARRTRDAALAAERKAAKGSKEASERLAGAWKVHDGMRDAVASLGPPAPDRDDLAGSWQALVRWTGEQARARRESAEQLAREARALGEERQKKVESLAAACVQAGVEIAPEANVRDSVVAALTRAEQEVARIEEALAKHAQWKEAHAAAKQEAAVAGSLAKHLGANAFERWLLEEAFGRLVADGSRSLRELSSGAYSFAADERLNFDIVDHRNADEVRSARTLSGGETFLASLALALALADQVAELAVEGAARLESMFLDEGFGTLDPDTLDTVASSIEELGARGRVVGLVTHVPELAERIPTQYRVSRGSDGARVERVVT
jgi:exonuclease SbcC